MENAKFRIYHQFEKCSDTRRNTEFLSKAYGIGSCSSFSYYSPKIGGMWNRKGLTLTFEDDSTVFLNWTQVSKIVEEMMTSEAYLTEKEKEDYASWYRMLYVNSKSNVTYSYEVGDTVTIDNTDYVVDEKNNTSVILSCKDFPLFTKEITIDKFNSALSASSSNDTLIDSFTDRSDEAYEEYCGIKDTVPGSLLLYQIGDFYEIMADLYENGDVFNVSLKLNLVTVYRSKKEGVYEVCGFPSKLLSEYLPKIKEITRSVAISKIVNNKRTLEMVL